MYDGMNFQQWTEYKALIRAFVAKNETLLYSERAKYLIELENFSKAARAQVLRKFPTESQENYVIDDCRKGISGKI